MRPDLMKLEPASVRPGETIEVFFPEETLRGIHFVLEIQEGDSWHLSYNLLSDWGKGRTPEAHAVDDSEEFSYLDIGIGGPGPDAVVMPDDVPAGSYRICTGNAGENFCASLTIEAA